MRQDQREAIEKIDYPGIRIKAVGNFVVYIQDKHCRRNFMHTCVLAGWSAQETVEKIIEICDRLKGVQNEQI